MRNGYTTPAGALACLLTLVALIEVLLLLAERAKPPPPLALPDPAFPDVNVDPPVRLLLLPGIGRARAEAIVAEREANGPFGALADLVRVHGIGERTASRVAEGVSADGP